MSKLDGIVVGRNCSARLYQFPARVFRPQQNILAFFKAIRTGTNLLKYDLVSDTRSPETMEKMK